MNLESKIIEFALNNAHLKTRDIADKFGVTRQYAHSIISSLVRRKKLVKLGSTKKALYIHPDHSHEVAGTVNRRLHNKDLDETEVMIDLEAASNILALANDDVKSIFQYAFSEMLNNAIEHSQSKYIEVAVNEARGQLFFHVNDAGIGVFRNVMDKRKLHNELEAIQDLLKGKTTTMPKLHSGEGIFFTSKVADLFVLESFDYKLTVDNQREDIFVEELKSKKRGTKVTFVVSMASKKHLSDIFRKYQTDPSELAFDKTEIQVRLYTMGTIHISRSQARRVMAGLEKFNVITLDFDRVPTVGQAFVDEIFRVFQTRYPHIKIIPINMNKTVKFMVERGRVKP